MAPPIRVLVVDDSALMRQALGQLLSRDPAIEVVGAASDPYVARDKIRALNPDVLTLDVEMPRMDGLTFLEKLMRAHPMPVVMVSSLTEAGCETTLRALELGAVEFVTKPKLDVRERLPEVAAEIISKVKAAALARVRSRPAAGVRAPARAAAPSLPRALRTTQKIVALGASTGGTEALKDVLSALPADCPPLIIVQHMPEKFTRAFADRLDGLCTLGVKEAEDGDRVIAGHALIAPGNCHMRLVREGSMYFVRIDQEPPVNQHRPSVDVLFNSCATAAGANAVGVLMTGMGEDGARGLVAMRKAGARTLAQDEASCVVFGMPRAAVELGGAEHVVSLDAIADTVLGLTR